MIKEYGIYRTHNIYVGNKYKGLIVVMLGFRDYSEAENELTTSNETKYKYKGAEYI